MTGITTGEPNEPTWHSRPWLYIVGYGFDYEQKFPNLPFVATIRSEALGGQANPAGES